MNIILKSFDGNDLDPFILETALKGLKIGTCISVANDTTLLPKLDAQEHIWQPAAPLRAGRYPDVNWAEITPIDEELIEQMRHAEAVFYTMIERYMQKGEMHFMERRRQYRMHLRYWNHVLNEKKIDLLLLNHAPHQGYDYVLYYLCRLKGIPTLHLERAHVMDTLFVWDDWEDAGRELRERFDELKQQYGEEAHVPLSDNFEHYFREFSEQNTEPFFMNRVKLHKKSKSFVQKWWKPLLSLLHRNPWEGISTLLSPAVWSRRLRQHRITQMYFRHMKEPDLSRKYIYVPLHAQPEMSSCPMAGAYVDQQLIVQMLAKCAPPDVAIYVREHPIQGEHWRSEAFFHSLLEIPSVTLVPKDFDVFTLIEHAAAVATGAGTSAFQAIFHGKPALLFGHRFFQFAPGIHRIRTTKDCMQAIEKIFNEHAAPAPHDLRIFLKAVEECSVPYLGEPYSPRETLTQQEKAQLIGQKISEKIRAVR